MRRQIEWSWIAILVLAIVGWAAVLWFVNTAVYAT